jgi:hypothetical protein
MLKTSGLGPSWKKRAGSILDEAVAFKLQYSMWILWSGISGFIKRGLDRFRFLSGLTVLMTLEHSSELMRGSREYA